MPPSKVKTPEQFAILRAAFDRAFKALVDMAGKNGVELVGTLVIMAKNKEGMYFSSVEQFTE